jgi:glycosyltransferase involved in cell wall biosynthesis
MNQILRIAAIGDTNSFFSKDNFSGAGEILTELYARLVKKGHKVTIYCKLPAEDAEKTSDFYNGVKILWSKNINIKLFNSIYYTLQTTLNIICCKEFDIIHIHVRNFAFWSILFRLAGKKVFVSANINLRDKENWLWYNKLAYLSNNYFIATFSNHIIFNDIQTQAYFIKKFKNFSFSNIPPGFDFKEPFPDNNVFEKLNLLKGRYFLIIFDQVISTLDSFVADVFNKLNTDFRLLVICNLTESNKHDYLHHYSSDKRIIFIDFHSVENKLILVKHAYAFIQTQIQESIYYPITAMGLGTPVICCESIYNYQILRKNAILYEYNNNDSLSEALKFSLLNHNIMLTKALEGQSQVKEKFNWDKITDQYIKIFSK